MTNGFVAAGRDCDKKRKSICRSCVDAVFVRHTIVTTATTTMMIIRTKKTACAIVVVVGVVEVHSDSPRSPNIQRRQRRFGCFDASSSSSSSSSMALCGCSSMSTEPACAGNGLVAVLLDDDDDEGTDNDSGLLRARRNIVVE